MRTLSAALVVSCASLNGAVFAATDDVRAEAREIYAHVVALKTSEGLGQVPVMAAYLAEKLRAAGFPEEEIHILPLGETASFVARYRGDGSGGRRRMRQARQRAVQAGQEQRQGDDVAGAERAGERQPPAEPVEAASAPEAAPVLSVAATALDDDDHQISTGAPFTGATSMLILGRHSQRTARVAPRSPFSPCLAAAAATPASVMA